MKFHIYKDKEELAERLGAWICDLVATALKTKEYFTMVLSGGNTPKILFKKLVSDYSEKINWKQVQIFWGDERVVPFNDARNNAKMGYELLLNHIDIPPSQVHIMRTNTEPSAAAKEYENLLQKYFDKHTSSFDLVLLGMGDDGHTLSLFPGSPLVSQANHDWVESVYNEEQQMNRITLMPEIVNRAVNIAFMVDGSKKAARLKEVVEGPFDPKQLPAQIIKPLNGQLHWFLDKEAAKDLQSV